MEQELGTPPCGQQAYGLVGGALRDIAPPRMGRRVAVEQQDSCWACRRLAGWLTDRQLRGPTLTAAGEFAATAGLTGNYPVESWILITEAREWNR